MTEEPVSQTTQPILSPSAVQSTPPPSAPQKSASPAVSGAGSVSPTRSLSPSINESTSTNAARELAEAKQQIQQLATRNQELSSRLAAVEQSVLQINALIPVACRA